MFKKYKDKLKKTIEQWANNSNETQALYKVKIEASIEEIIQRHIQKLSISSYRGFYYIENSVRDCINDIAQAKGDLLMMPRYQHLKDWSKRANWEYINLRDTSLERFKSRYSDLQKLEEERKNKEKERKNKQVSDAYSDLRKKYADLIQKFFEVTERKVSIIDDYGDENWDELPKQIEIVIKKIAKDRGGYFDAKNWKKFPFTNPDEFEQFKLLRDDLNREFKTYHERTRHRDIGFNSDVISKMSGDEFGHRGRWWHIDIQQTCSLQPEELLWKQHSQSKTPFGTLKFGGSN
jgi:hypothetical protein